MSNTQETSITNSIDGYEDSGRTTHQPLDSSQHRQIDSGNASFIKTFKNRSSLINSYLNISEDETKLLDKFEIDVMQNEDAMKTITTLKPETQEKYIHQIKRYIRFCANKGLDNFIVTIELAKELIVSILSTKRDRVSENTVKSIRSPLNKLFYMNKVVYSTQQPDISLGKQFIQDIMSSFDKCDHSGKIIAGSSSSLSTNEQKSISTDSGNTSLYSQPKKRLLQDINDTEEVATPTTSSSSYFKLGETTKHKLNEREINLLNRFDTEVLESAKTKNLLDNLTENTFKAYSTDIRRFIRFCAKQGKTEFLINRAILTKFLSYTVDKDYSRNSLKNLRTSLLKLHQLNCLAYDLDYSEGEIIFILNEFLESQAKSVAEPVACVLNEQEEKIINELKELYSNSAFLSDLSIEAKRLYSAEFNRFALFCNKENFDQFKITGDIIVKYFRTEKLFTSPSCSIKVLKDSLTRIQFLHRLNHEKFPGSLPQEIANSGIVDEFLSEYEKIHPTNSTNINADDNGDSGPSTHSGASSSGSSLGANIPPLVFTNDVVQPALPQPAPVSSSLSSDQSGDYSQSQTLRKSMFRHREKGYLRQRGILPNHPESVINDESSSSSSDGVARVDELANKKFSGEPEVKRQRLEALPETNHSIPQFVMNGNIKTVTQVVEEWSLILKRKEKWDLGWIKDLTDFQLYKSRKVITDFILQLIPDFDEAAESKAFDQVGDDLIYETARIFDQYIERKKISLNDLIRKIQVYPVYTRKEFSRILTRKKIKN